MSNETAATDQDAAAINLMEVVDGAARLISPLVVVRQHAVGHGGFHTGALGLKSPQIRWIYDCGGWRKIGKTALNKQITKYAKLVSNAAPVDLLFLSHFDADHVSGVRQFLKKVQVETAVVPYLEPEEIFGIIAEAAAAHVRKQEIENLGQAMLNPGSWFGDQGVRRVVRLRPGASPGEPALPEPPSLTPSADRPVQVVLTGADGTAVPLGSGSGQVIDADPGLSGEVRYRTGLKVDWSFLPFVHPVSPIARECLQQAAHAVVGAAVTEPSFGSRLIDLIGSKGGLKRLRDIYVDRELADANGKSLSLYAGPLIGALRRHLAPATSRTHGSGWLLTGDAKLRSQSRRAAWGQHYGFICPHLISNLMLPHHGAATNFHAQILEIAPSAQLFITADAGDALRPHEDVLAGLGEAGDARQILRVTEDSGTEIWQVSGDNGYCNDPLVQGCVLWT